MTVAARLPVISFTALRWGDLLLPTPKDPAGFKPPSTALCYRFCLEHQARVRSARRTCGSREIGASTYRPRPIGARLIKTSGLDAALAKRGLI
jgi:hypothetical protein